jgi:regulator of nucleoside diphosphate kinase
MSRSPRRARAVIDATLVERLDSLAGAAVARLPETAYPLVNKLSAAKLVPPARLPADVVTIGSEVAYRDDLTGRAMRVRLVWPEHADISRGRVSVLTPVGVALLGLSAGRPVPLDHARRRGARADRARGHPRGLQFGRGLTRPVELPCRVRRKSAMYRRFIPAVCETCRQPVPRAAAWRCPSCRTEFTTVVTTRPGRPRRGLADRPAIRAKDRIAAPRDPRRLP